MHGQPIALGSLSYTTVVPEALDQHHTTVGISKDAYLQRIVRFVKVLKNSGYWLKMTFVATPAGSLPLHLVELTALVHLYTVVDCGDNFMMPARCLLIRMAWAIDPGPPDSSTSAPSQLSLCEKIIRRLELG